MTTHQSHTPPTQKLRVSAALRMQTEEVTSEMNYVPLSCKKHQLSNRIHYAISVKQSRTELF